MAKKNPAMSVPSAIKYSTINISLRNIEELDMAETNPAIQVPSVIKKFKSKYSLKEHRRTIHGEDIKQTSILELYKSFRKVYRQNSIDGKAGIEQNNVNYG